MRSGRGSCEGATASEPEPEHCADGPGRAAACAAGAREGRTAFGSVLQISSGISFRKDKRDRAGCYSPCAASASTSSLAGRRCALRHHSRLDHQQRRPARLSPAAALQESS